MNFTQNMLSGMLKHNQIEIIQLDFGITYVAPLHVLNSTYAQCPALLQRCKTF